jgi:hypothetical protein
MATFAQTLNPSPFGLFDADIQFQAEADAMVTFVKRKLGDDILSVELTKKQIWACFEESLMTYSSIINENQAKSQMSNLLGIPTGSLLSGSEQKLPRETVEFMLRRAEPYAVEAGLGGMYTQMSGAIDLHANQQDYDIYKSLKDSAGNLIVDNAANSPKGKMKIMEVYHFEPQAAYRFFDTNSALNYLNNEFSFESFTPETAFYVLPVFEDVLRAGQLNLSYKIRRSNYTYRVTGTKLRIYPIPTSRTSKKLWLSVQFPADPLNPPVTDDTIHGVSNISNIPYGNLMYERINSIGRQWIRQYTLASSKELLGLIRSKFSSIPIPGAELTLNGGDLVAQGREEKTVLKDKLGELLSELTYSKMLEDESTASDSLRNILKGIPIPLGKAITMG